MVHQWWLAIWPWSSVIRLLFPLWQEGRIRACLIGSIQESSEDYLSFARMHFSLKCSGSCNILEHSATRSLSSSASVSSISYLHSSLPFFSKANVTKLLIWTSNFEGNFLLRFLTGKLDRNLIETKPKLNRNFSIKRATHNARAPFELALAEFRLPKSELLLKFKIWTGKIRCIFFVT